MPIVATNKPSSSEIPDLTCEPEAMNTPQVRPRHTSQKYSNELNLMATSASAGAAVTSTIVPMMPPIAEKTTPAPRATSPWPFLVMAYASSA